MIENYPIDVVMANPGGLTVSPSCTYLSATPDDDETVWVVLYVL